HVPTSADLKAAIATTRTEAAERFEGLLEIAARAKGLRDRVENEVDGLATTRKRIDDLAGAESVARRATESARVRDWRESVLRAVDEWRQSFSPPSGPT